MLRKKAKFKFVPFTKKQKQALTWWIEHSPYKDKDMVIADGAIRSGKTLILSLSYVMWAMENYSHENFGMAGRTIGSFRRNVLILLKVILLLRGYRVKDRRTDNLLIVSKGNVENYFYIFGGKDESSQDLVQGFTAAGFFFDETTLMPESFVLQATARCSVEGAKLWFNCNPEGPFHWFKVNWIDQIEEKNGLRLQFDLNDNPSLSEARKDFYKRMYSGVFYQRFVLGLWAIAEGIIYDMFSTKNVQDDVESSGYDSYYVSIDYGTRNATVFLPWGCKNDTWYCFDEYYYSGKKKGKQKTDSEYADDFDSMFANIKQKLTVVLDPSAASFKTELRKRGYKVINANNDVINGIRATQTALQKQNIIFSSKCKNTIDEFRSYCWDIKKSEKGIDAPLAENDHCMDAVRYMVHTIIRTKGKIRKALSGKGAR